MRMSITRLYQIYDLTAQAAAGPIMAFRIDAAAIRAFNAVLVNKETLPGQYPDQFELRLLGEQDDQSSNIEPKVPPQIIATGSAWSAAQTEDLHLVKEA